MEATAAYRWQQRYIGDHICGVIRHAERADGAFVQNGGMRWTLTEDYALWPHDPPLSDDGLAAARDIGMRVRAFSEECGSKVRVVVTSPYTRCVQTAVQICQVLGSGTKVIVDCSIGEIYGPSVLGPTEPGLCTRRIDQMPRKGSMHSMLSKTPKIIGSWPTWPEDVRTARQRFANRFLTYLQRSITTRRNFLLVTHADCVMAALSVMPDYAGQVLEKIEFGGMFLARRRAEDDPALLIRRLIGGLLFSQEEEQELDDQPGADMIEDQIKEESHPVPDGWRLQTFGLSLHKLDETDSMFDKRAKALSKSGTFSQNQIRQLLGALGSQPLCGTSSPAVTTLSESTLVFGESSECRSSLPSEDSSRGAGFRRDAPVRKPQPATLVVGAPSSSPPVVATSSEKGTLEMHYKASRLQKARQALACADFNKEEECPPVILNAAGSNLLKRRGTGVEKLSL